LIRRKVFPEVKIDWMLFPTALLIAWGRFLEEYAVAYFSMVIHEMGHIAAALLFSKTVKCIRILPVGLNAEIENGTDSQWKHVLIILSGPLTNVLLFAASSAVNSLYFENSANIRFFVITNIYLAVFNLLPVLPLDGGRILKEVLKGRLGLISASRVTGRVSVFFCLALIAAGVIQLFNGFYNFSLLFAGLFILVALKQGKTEAALMNVKNIIFRRSRLLKKGIYPARDLVVMKTTLLGETIKNMDFDRFHLIYVLDEDLKIAGFFTEQEVFQALLNTKGDLTFGELLDKEKK